MKLLNKHIWFINAIYRAGQAGMSLKELNEDYVRTELSQGEPVIRQTFNRWLVDILDTFGIVIVCKRIGGYRYYIENPEVLKEGGVSSWLLDTYTTANVLAENLAIKDKIVTEEIPSSHAYLSDIMRAIRLNRKINIRHRSFGRQESKTSKVSPYGLKIFHKRWYLIGHHSEYNKVLVYGLDRIEEVTLCTEGFVYPSDFDAEVYFSSAFGVVLDLETPIQRIVLRADRYHQHYLRTLPIHHSQKELYSCEEYADFELRLRPTYDFCMELLHYGSMVEVLEPQSLRHEMKEWVEEMWDMYKND